MKNRLTQLPIPAWSRTRLQVLQPPASEGPGQPPPEPRPVQRAARRCWLAAAILFTVPAAARAPELRIEIRNHLFEPSELVVPANTKIKLMVYNRDATPEEFESYELNREKVIMGNTRAVIFIGPLPPGEYPFFGEFNPERAQGKIIAR